MSSYFLNEAWKIKNQRHAKRSFLRNLIHKEKVKKKNRLKSSINHDSKIHSKSYNKEKNEFRIDAPIKCSILNNTDEFCKFISDIHFFYKARKPIFVNMKNVQEIDDDAILVMLSIMIEFKEKKIRYNGNYPENKEIADKFRNSQFFKYLDAKTLKDDQYELNSLDNQILTHANKNVNPILASTILDDATTFLWGKPKWCKGAYRTIIELMQNTNNHAELGHKGAKHWWLSISKNKDENKVYFSFVDYGIGIFKSLEKKKESSWLKSAYNILKKELYSNHIILKKMLFGEISNTSTGEIYRGKGIPGIKEVLDRNGISSLYIITNDVYADVSNGDFSQLKNHINGTFVYWELNMENIYHEK
jgi:hypothetical protein